MFGQGASGELDLLARRMGVAVSDVDSEAVCLPLSDRHTRKPFTGFVDISVTVIAVAS